MFKLNKGEKYKFYVSNKSGDGSTFVVEGIYTDDVTNLGDTTFLKVENVYSTISCTRLPGLFNEKSEFVLINSSDIIMIMPI